MEGAKKTYAVWVGNLTDEITEAMLFEEFKCYGPICNVKFGKSKGKKRIAFINFYSKEVAEVAAYDMNDTLIYGIQIKTSFKDENHKAKDIRPFTDCVNFMAKKSCAKVMIMPRSNIFLLVNCMKAIKNSLAFFPSIILLKSVSKMADNGGTGAKCAAHYVRGSRN